MKKLLILNKSSHWTRFVHFIACRRHVSIMWQPFDASGMFLLLILHNAQNPIQIYIIYLFEKQPLKFKKYIILHESFGFRSAPFFSYELIGSTN